MGKTLFGRVVMSISIIIVVSFLIGSSVIYVYLGEFVAGEKIKLLRHTGNQINELLTEMNEYNNKHSNDYIGNILSTTFTRYIANESLNTNSIIFVSNSKGEIVYTYYEVIPESVFEKLYNSNTRSLKFSEEEQINAIKHMDGLIKYGGDFYGLFEDTDVSWLTVVLPYKYAENSEVVGGVYLFTQIPELQKARASVFKIFLLSVLLSIIISVVGISILTKKMSKPVEEIKVFVREISKGNFEKKLDIKVYKEFEELIRNFDEMAISLKSLEKMKRDFIANVTHEIRTPMTSIKGFVDAIIDGTVPREKQNQYLYIIKDEIIRLNNLVNSLLLLSTIESGEYKISPCDFEINEILKRTVIKFQNEINNKKLQVEVVLPEEPIIVFADNESIQRVLINLIDNAIKFSDEKGILKINLENQDKKVAISISDNGIGMSKDEIKHIWDRFYKADKSRSKNKLGTGIGLSIVKNILSQHNQDIEVISKLSEGTVFRFTLDKSKSKKY